MSSDNIDSNSSDGEEFVVVQQNDTEESLMNFPTLMTEPSDNALSDDDQNDSVNFINVQRVYPVDQDIRVCFETSRTFASSENDFIGLFIITSSECSDLVASELVPRCTSLGPLFVTIKSSSLPSQFSYEEYFEFRYVLGNSRAVKGISPKFHLIRSLRNEASLPLQSLSNCRLSEMTSPLVSLSPDPCCKCVELHAVKNQLDAAMEAKAMLRAELSTINERMDHLNNVFQVTQRDNVQLHTALKEKEMAMKALEEQNARQDESIRCFTSTMMDKDKDLKCTTRELKDAVFQRDNLLAEVAALNNRRALSEDAKEEYDARIAVLEASKADLTEQVADKEAWISSIDTELQRLTGANEALTQDNNDLVEKGRAASDEIDLIRSELLRMRARLDNASEVQSALEAASDRRELEFADREKAFEFQVQHIDEELKAAMRRNATFEAEVKELSEEKKRFSEELGELTARLETKDNEAESLRIQSMQLQLGKQEAEEEVQRLRGALEQLRTVEPAPARAPETNEMRDVDVLVKYLPSLTQTLIGISNTEMSQNTQKVIKELRDMIRFLLTAHEKMKSEVRRLRSK